MNIIVRKMDNFMRDTAPYFMFVIMDKFDHDIWKLGEDKFNFMGTETEDIELDATVPEVFRVANMMARVEELKGNNVANTITIFTGVETEKKNGGRSKKRDEDNIYSLKDFFEDRGVVFEESVSGTLAFVKRDLVNDDEIKREFPQWFMS